MAVQIQIRGDTAANWTAANPTLAAREIGIETDTVKLKIGTGATVWNSLAYFSSGGVTDGDKGDIVVSGSGTVWSIDTGVVTLAQMANLATNNLIGRVTAGTGVPEAIAFAANTFPARSSAGQLAAKTLTDFALTFLDDPDAATVRGTLGIGAVALQGDGDKGDIIVSGSGSVWSIDTTINLQVNRLSVGGAGITGDNVDFIGNITGATNAAECNIQATVQSDVTSAAYGAISTLGTQAAAFTLTNLRHFRASQGTIGAGSTVTNQVGFSVATTLTGATNNYGFRGEIAAASGRWNVYMDGTAQNAFAGKVRFGGVTVPTTEVDITGTMNASADIQLNGASLRAQVQTMMSMRA